MKSCLSIVSCRGGATTTNVASSSVPGSSDHSSVRTNASPSSNTSSSSKSQAWRNTTNMTLTPISRNSIGWPTSFNPRGPWCSEEICSTPWAELVEGFEARPGLVERDQGAATDPDRLAVFLVAHTVGVRDGAGLLDVAKDCGQLPPLITDHDDGRRRHARRRPVIVGKVCRHHRRQTVPVKIERAGFAVVARQDHHRGAVG